MAKKTLQEQAADAYSKMIVDITEDEIEGEFSFSSEKLFSTTNVLRKRIISANSENNVSTFDPLTLGPFYLFITTPRFMNLDNESVSNYLKIGSASAPNELIRYLQGRHYGSTNFMKIFTNSLDSLSFDDIILDTTEISEGWEGSKLTVPKHTINSRQSGSVSFPFQEYENTPLTKIISIWIRYIEGVTRGFIEPSRVARTEKFLDYCCSIFGIVLNVDGRTIEKMVKYTGAFPTAIPYSNGEGKRGPSENVLLNIPFSFTKKETLDEAMIVADFNYITGESSDEVRIVERNNRLKLLFENEFDNLRY